MKKISKLPRKIAKTCKECKILKFVEVQNIKEVFTTKVTAALGVQPPDEEFTVVAFKMKIMPLPWTQ
jgi:hypothetical protein